MLRFGGTDRGCLRVLRRVRKGGLSILHALQKSYSKILTWYGLFSYFLKGELEECGGPWGTSGTCKFDHFCYKHCMRNPKFARDTCTMDSLWQAEGVCVSAEEKEEIEQGT